MSQSTFRPPAVPLVTHDPYFSVWSFNDKLTDDWTKHWTGKNQALVGMIRVDGKCFRWMSRGLEDVPAAEQVSLSALPSSTSYVFRAAGVEFKVSFQGHSNIKDAADLSRSDTRIHYQAKSTDGKEHSVAVYFDCSAELVVDNPSQEVGWSRVKREQEVLSAYHEGGRALNRVGDDHRIDWGRLYLCPGSRNTRIGSSEEVRREFVDTGRLLGFDDTRQPRAVWDAWPVLACATDEQVVRPGAASEVGAVTLLYDDDFSIEYFGRPLRAAWRNDGQTDPLSVFVAGSHAAQAQWDADSLMDSWSSISPEFAHLAALSYRQSLAAHKIVRDIDGTLLMFSKENFSNGCIGTVDVMYPACPIFLAYNPELARANMEPIMQYASMPRWKWKFAPHDLGTYPKANGQVYGGGERTEDNQMPVEESGNMLIMAAAYLEKTGDKAWIEKYWGKFTEWAEYLREFGVDPGNQLCTDDFAGHLAHNANLSVKAIVAMACYGRMAKSLGKRDVGAAWEKTAKGFVQDWMKMADDGDHYRLAFDKPGTWSQKYNLVWDKVLRLGLFPQEVYDKEVAYYLQKMEKYGLPLDNRADYTKLDWTVWTACLTSRREDFDAIMAPVYRWMNETPDRLPLTDWYSTKSGRCVGFRARSVVGGVFMPLLMK